MVDILFYHLTQSTLEDIFPILVERALVRFNRVTVQCISEEQRDSMDTRLWTYSHEGFIGHGTECDKYPDFQPVYLTTGAENPNDSKVRLLVGGAICADVNEYQRLVVMFEGCDDEQLAIARVQWKEYKTGNHNLIYWQQTEDRRWEKRI